MVCITLQESTKTPEKMPTNESVAKRHLRFLMKSAVMPMNAGVQAVSENNYGRPKRGIRLHQKELTNNIQLCLSGRHV